MPLCQVFSVSQFSHFMLNLGSSAGMKEHNEKTKEFVFSEEIDSAINGYALGATLLGIGIFLLIKPDYFPLPIVSYIIGAVIGILGTLGIGIELSKTAKIKGINNIAIGVVLVAIWLVTYLKIQSLWVNIMFIILLILGCFAVFLGIFQGIYSIIENVNVNKQQKKEHPERGKTLGSMISQIILFLTQLCGLGLAIINIIKAAGIS